MADDKRAPDVHLAEVVSDASQRNRRSRYQTGALLIRPAGVARVLLGIAGLLVLVHVGGHMLALKWDNTLTRVLLLEFSVSAEENVPTFFSTALLLLSSFLLVVVSAKRRGAVYAARWALLAFIFLILALDEAAGMHEYFNEPFRDLLGAAGPLYYAWVIPGALFTTALFAYYLPFLRHLSSRTGRLILLSGLLYVAGAIGVELLGAQYYYSYGVKDFPYSLLTAVEETLEMTGVITLIYTLLDYLRQLPGPVQIHIEKTNSATRP